MAGFSSPQSQANKRKILLSLREDITEFTEVNSNPEIESKISNLMKPHYTLWSNGCCIWINAKSEATASSPQSSLNGRVLMAEITWKDITFHFAVIYGPAQTKDKLTFFNELKKINFPSNTVFTGDYYSWRLEEDKPPIAWILAHSLSFPEWTTLNQIMNTAEGEGGYPLIYTRSNPNAEKAIPAPRLDTIFKGPDLPLLNSLDRTTDIAGFDHRKIVTTFRVDIETTNGNRSRVLPWEAGRRWID